MVSSRAPGSPLADKGSPHPEGRLARQVPAGREGVGNGRLHVGEIQCARITEAMSELVREHGPTDVTVAHIVARSGVSRRTFYELFEDREDCLLMAFERAVAMAGGMVIPAYQTPERWPLRTRAALAAMLQFLDSEPEMGYLCVVGALGGGTRALERRARIIRVLVDAVHEGRKEVKSQKRPERLVAEGVVGAVLAVVHARLLEHDDKPLLGLLNPLMGMIVLPYLGPAAAQRETAKPTPKVERPPQPRGDPLRELDMRLTYRTVRVLLAVAGHPAASNRQVATAAGVTDQGQISKLLARLQNLGLIHNTGGDHTRGEPNAWALTPKGQQVTHTLQAQSAH